MIKWRIVEQYFFETIKIKEKGFLNKDDAEKVAKKYDKATEFDIYYFIEPYQEKTLFNINKIQIK